MEGIRGSSFTGDIAIDDFVCKSGTCAILPASAKPGTQVSTTPLPTPTPTQPPVGGRSLFLKCIVHVCCVSTSRVKILISDKKCKFARYITALFSVTIMVESAHSYNLTNMVSTVGNSH